MRRVLIAADGTDQSVDAARAAHRLFGDDTEYLVINVGRDTIGQFGATAWGTAYPVVMPMPTPAAPVAAPMTTGVGPDHVSGGAHGIDAEIDRAVDRAEQVAAAADLVDAEALGDVGDPAEAILDAARLHDVDVIVVGSHERNWFTRLFTGSVAEDVVRAAGVPVLVIT